MRSWIFQANPKRYDLLAAVREGTDNEYSLTAHRDDVAEGDRVWFRLGGDDLRGGAAHVGMMTPCSGFGFGSSH